MQRKRLTETQLEKAKLVLFSIFTRFCQLSFFRSYIIGEENHNLCCVFFQILPNLHDLHPLQLVPNLVTLAQLVMHPPIRQESRFESHIHLTFLRRRKISRCLAGILLFSKVCCLWNRTSFYLRLPTLSQWCLLRRPPWHTLALCSVGGPTTHQQAQHVLPTCPPLHFSTVLGAHDQKRHPVKNKQSSRPIAFLRF